MSGARRLTRAQALTGGAVVAAGAALAARRLTRGGGAPEPVLHRAAHRYTRDFAAAAPGRGWGAEWAALHDRRVFVAGAAAVFAVPAGLVGTAAAQPMPVHLLDHDCGDCEQLATFSITHRALRPGLLLHSSGPYEFTGVTAEQGRLVVAAYGREQRQVAVTRPAIAIAEDATVHLRVRARGTRLQATLWHDGDAEPAPQIDTAVAAGRGGCGILLVHPPDLQACSLELHRYALGTEGRVTPTPPHLIMALTGIPQVDAGGDGHTLARVWSAFPATATIEWGDDPALASPTALPPARLGQAPYTHAARIPLARAGERYWRATLRSATSDATVRTAVQHVRPYAGSDPLVLLAVSCAQLTGPPPNAGYTRLLEAAPAQPAALVYQGDIGYPNNTAEACYAAAPDYFADRFGRLLADPRWTRLRTAVPVGFTMDDHDYGPPNNADRTTVEPWTWQLWNRIHADPAPVGYFDFRMGDVHCLTLDGRRYADPVTTPNRPGKSKLGRDQLAWMQRILETSDAAMFVVYSADIFASRWNPRDHEPSNDCFVTGWPDEYRRVMTLFMDAQLTGRRVVVLSGDAHGLRIHYHPDPRGRPQAASRSIVEFICSGLRPGLWTASNPTDATLDPNRHVIGRPGGGMLIVDPAGAASRSLTMRAIQVDEARPFDAFPPLRLDFAPGDDRRAAGI
ncbi:MAG TPA: alkaline phosphatase D family protein [Gaiellales bacterium]